jgi:hypothetical protein
VCLNACLNDVLLASTTPNDMREANNSHGISAPALLFLSTSSVGMALGYGLDNRSSRVRFPARAVNFSLHHRVQIGSGAHSSSYPMGTRGSFLWGKAAGTWS